MGWSPFKFPMIHIRFQKKHKQQTSEDDTSAPVRFRIWNLRFSKGFTLVELLVVISIMGLIAGSVIANYAGLRPQRNLGIAENELVTNLRKIQSYSLSSRNAPNGQSVEYYIMKINTASPSSYTIEALYNTKNPPSGGTGTLVDIETVNLPQGIVIRSIAASAPNPNANPTCALLVFQLPFSKIITNTSCTADAAQTPPLVKGGDDYDKVIKFLYNNGTSVSRDTKTTITLANDTGSISRWVTLNGVTGLVNFQ